MLIEDRIKEIQDAAFEDSDHYVEVEYKLRNWETDFTRDDVEFRNYRTDGNTDFTSVVEHAMRRGENLELVITVQLGSVNNFPEDKVKAAAWLERKQAEIALVAEAKAEKNRIDQKLADQLAALDSE